MSSMNETFYGGKEPSFMAIRYGDESHNFNPFPRPSMELRVPMCCTKCADKVKEALLKMDGVDGVLCDEFNQKVSVSGTAHPERVLRRVRRIKKLSEILYQNSNNNNKYNSHNQLLSSLSNFSRKPHDSSTAGSDYSDRDHNQDGQYSHSQTPNHSNQHDDMAYFDSQYNPSRNHPQMIQYGAFANHSRESTPAFSENMNSYTHHYVHPFERQSSHRSISSGDSRSPGRGTNHERPQQGSQQYNSSYRSSSPDLRPQSYGEDAARYESTHRSGSSDRSAVYGNSNNPSLYSSSASYMRSGTPELHDRRPAAYSQPIGAADDARADYYAGSYFY